MKACLIIFGGISFPYRLIDRAVAWSKASDAMLHSLFIVGKETEEGYPFPSDLDAAENLTNKENVIQIDVEIIKSQMKFMNDAGRAGSISTKSDVLVDPSLEAVMEKVRGAKMLFISANYEEIASLSDLSFEIKDLIDQAPCPVEKVSEN